MSNSPGLTGGWGGGGEQWRLSQALNCSVFQTLSMPKEGDGGGKGAENLSLDLGCPWVSLV